MSSDSRVKGKAIKENRFATQILEELYIDHEFTEEELMDGEFEELIYDNEKLFDDLSYSGYVVAGKDIYKLMKFEESDDIYQNNFTENGDGSYSFDFVYYNGGCHWAEIFEDEIENVKK